MAMEASQKPVQAVYKPLGRKAHTGKYNTREELEDAIWNDYRTLEKTTTRQLAHLNGCSTAIVQQVLGYRTPYQKARLAKIQAERDALP